MTCLIGLAVVGRSAAAPGSALKADPAIPVPSKAMATATTALQYCRTRRLATVAGMVPSLGFDLADTPGFRVVAKSGSSLWASRATTNRAPCGARDWSRPPVDCVETLKRAALPAPRRTSLLQTAHPR